MMSTNFMEWKIALRRPFEGMQEQDVKLIKLLQRIKEFNEEFSFWEAMLTKFARSNSFRVTSSSNVHWSSSSGKGTKRPVENRSSSMTPDPPSSKKSRIEEGSRDACWTCGNVHKGECRLKTASWANQDPMKHWSASEKGKDWATKNWNTCPPSLEAGKYPKDVWKVKFRSGKKQGVLAYLNHFDTDSKLPHILISLSLIAKNQVERRNKVEIKALLDCGATNNFVSRSCLKLLEVKLNNLTKSWNNIIVLTGFLLMQSSKSKLTISLLQRSLIK